MSHILIIERGMGRSRNRIYTYMESPAHFASVMTMPVVDGGRNANKRVDSTVFERECDARVALNPGEWTSFNVEV